DVTLYASLASRSFVARWLLEEIGIPYRVEILSLRKGEHKRPEYLRINPMGKVPALTDGAVTVAETPAICIYLADRYSYGLLAPRMDAPQRGAYLHWTVFSTAVLEPACYLPRTTDPRDAAGAGWGSYETMVDALSQGVTR